MPYAQLHYPFENKELVDSRSYYPADFIAEGVDQTRGWFFTLHAIATMVFDSVAYKNVISNGLVLDKNGNKMSKRLGNAVDPFGAIEKFGSDPLRWYMITNSSPWDNLKFDTDGVDEVRRKFFGTLYNTYSFFALYANVDGFTYAEEDVPMNERPEIDRWILSLLNSLIKNVDACFADYEPTKAGRLITDFVNDNLSNWYVRLNRKRFWGSAMSTDKLSAYQTLYTCLETVAKLMAPIAPFYADRLYMDLIAVTGRDQVVSVHLAKFPVADENLIKNLDDNSLNILSSPLVYDREAIVWHKPSRRQRKAERESGLAPAPVYAKTIGEHQGVQFYTIGQRKGLNIGGHKDSIFIIATDTETNTIYVGEGDGHPGLLRPALFIDNSEIHWIRRDLEMENGEIRRYKVRIRYRQPLQEAILAKRDNGLYIIFEQQQRGITPGQFAVWYDGDEMLGSGPILR
jgi:isoleucyl-tRNA synthetase